MEYKRKYIILQACGTLEGQNVSTDDAVHFSHIGGSQIVTHYWLQGPSSYLDISVGATLSVSLIKIITSQLSLLIIQFELYCP